MSIERELLERAMSLIDYRYAPSEAILVHREIKELLAQPEQTEREPLSDEQKRLAAIAIKQREAHGIGGGE